MHTGAEEPRCPGESQPLYGPHSTMVLALWASMDIMPWTHTLNNLPLSIHWNEKNNKNSTFTVLHFLVNSVLFPWGSFLCSCPASRYNLALITIYILKSSLSYLLSPVRNSYLLNILNIYFGRRTVLPHRWGQLLYVKKESCERFFQTQTSLSILFAL